MSEFLDSQTHPTKMRLRDIVLELWPDISSAREGARRMADVEDVLAGLPVSTLSQKDRDAIKAAAQRLERLGS